MINYNNKNLNNAKKMRKNLTPWEGKLWHLHLKRCKPKFYRQRLIDDYIIDFYCPQVRLAIELDGSQHREKANILYDLKRTEILNSLNIKVVRFSNLDIDNNLEGVILAIKKEINDLQNQ